MRKHVQDAIRQSLNKLRTDYLDVVHVHHHHHHHYDTLHVAITTLHEMAQEGHVRCVLHPRTGKHEKEKTAKWYSDHTLARPLFSTHGDHNIRATGIGLMIGMPETLSLWLSSHVRAVARRLGVTGAQVLLRWSLQVGVVVMPCTGNSKHLAENSPHALLRFELTKRDMRQLGEVTLLMAPLAVPLM
jgi:diketogulonate reductase-like aldo/keto reductase